MGKEYIYHYKKSRKQHAKLFVRIGVASLFYIMVLYFVKMYLKIAVPNDIHLIFVASLSIAAVILFLIAWWHIKNPAIYEAWITHKQFSIVYPNVPDWSFTVNTDDIVRFENRQRSSSVDMGILMINGNFHKISMNCGNDINKMYKALKTVRPDIEFSKSVRTTFSIR